MDPITRTVSKHLLPSYDKSMVYYTIPTLVIAEIRDFLTVTGSCNAGYCLCLLGNGRAFEQHFD